MGVKMGVKVDNTFLSSFFTSYFTSLFTSYFTSYFTSIMKTNYGHLLILLVSLFTLFSHHVNERCQFHRLPVGSSLF